MRTSAFTAAKLCLVVGCLAAVAMLVVPAPRGSDEFLAAHDARRPRRSSLSPAPESLLAQRDPAARRLRDIFVSPTSSDLVRTAGRPPANRLAANDGARVPLTGLDQPPTPPLAPAEPTVTFRVTEPDPTGGLVPEPTPDPLPIPADAGLAVEVRALRDEVLRLAQAGTAPENRGSTEQSEELRRLTEELRNTERFRQLEDQLRSLQSGASGQASPSPPGSVGTQGDPSPLPLSPSLPLPAAPLVRALPSEAGDDRFTLQVESADVTQVLDLLGQMAGWNVVAAPGVTGSVTLNLRDVTLDEALDAVLSPRDLVAERKDNLLFVMPKTEALARSTAARVLVTKVYRPNYISVKDLQELVTPLLTATIGKVSVTSPNLSGIEIGSTTAGGDSLSQRDALVVQDYPEVIEQVDEIVAEMDVAPMQVVIEAYILRVRLEDEMRLGVNFAILNGSGRQLVTTGSGAELATSTGFPGERSSLVPPLPGFLGTAAGLRYGFLTGDVTGFIEALEGISETSLVASPSLRVLNKQKAELIIGQRLGYKTQTFNNQQTIENVEFLDVGTKLVLRPYAAPDGLVRMEIHPERSSGIIDDNGIPQVDTTQVTTNVMVRDGTTVVIGGLIDEQTQESLSQVPLLGSIPLIGNAFRNTTEELIRSELIVLITPRIVNDPVEEARGEVIKAESEQRAAHFSNNLSPVSRRNLGRMHVERAAELYNRGRLAEAHDHVREALAIRKNDGEALRLKNLIEGALRNRRRGIFGLPAEPLPVLPPDALPSEAIHVETLPAPEIGPAMPGPSRTQIPPAPAPEPVDPFPPTASPSN